MAGPRAQPLHLEIRAAIEAAAMRLCGEDLRGRAGLRGWSRPVKILRKHDNIQPFSSSIPCHVAAGFHTLVRCAILSVQEPPAAKHSHPLPTSQLSKVYTAPPTSSADDQAEEAVQGWRINVNTPTAEYVE